MAEGEGEMDQDDSSRDRERNSEREESSSLRIVLDILRPSKPMESWITTSIDDLVIDKKSKSIVASTTSTRSSSKFLVEESQDMDDDNNDHEEDDQGDRVSSSLSKRRTHTISSYSELQWQSNQSDAQTQLVKGYGERHQVIHSTSLTEWLQKDTLTQQDYVLLEPIKQYSVHVENKIF
jgi:hypothetical protein